MPAGAGDGGGAVFTRMGSETVEAPIAGAAAGAAAADVLSAGAAARGRQATGASSRVPAITHAGAR
jgi:hypothetical protein